MLKTNVQILEETRTFLKEAEQNKIDYVTHKGAFSKPKKLSFLHVILFLLQLPKKSLSVELEDFYDELKSPELICTKSALSQARYKLKEDFFEKWNKELVKSYYTDNDEGVMLWNGFQLHGVDGTTAYLPTNELIKERFGVHTNQHHVGVPMARILGRYDLLNHIVVDAEIAPIRQGENVMAIDQLDQLHDKVLSIYDRNFAAFEVIYEHQKRNLPFLIRSNLTANNIIKDFVKSEERSAIVKFHATNTAIKSLKKKGVILTKQDGKLKILCNV